MGGSTSAGPASCTPVSAGSGARCQNTRTAATPATATAMAENTVLASGAKASTLSAALASPIRSFTTKPNDKGMPAIDMPASAAAAAVHGMAWRRLPSRSMMRVPVP